MSSGTTALLVEGGASHTWVVVADRDRVWTDERLPAVNRVGGSAESQRSLLADIARVAAGAGPVQDAYFAVGAAATPAYLGEFAALVTESLPPQLRPAGRTCITNDVVPLLFAEDSGDRMKAQVSAWLACVAEFRNFLKDPNAYLASAP